MSNGFLSQEEIDSLLNGGGMSTPAPVENEEMLSEVEKDLLGEIGNISMGSASTALSQIINQQVNITTPRVNITTLNELKDSFQVPNIAVEVEFTSGIMGENLLVMKLSDAAVIANLMMGGTGVLQETPVELSEIEESAVSEAMNQMIGSAATSMATMFSREVNISPPKSKVWTDYTRPLADGIGDDENVVTVSFKLTIGELVDSEIMQLLPMDTAKKIVGIMMGEDNVQEEPVQQPKEEPVSAAAPAPQREAAYEAPAPSRNSDAMAIRPKEPVTVSNASFEELRPMNRAALPNNIDLILDVPLEISVVLGKTRKTIKEILNFGTGSLIELDKLAEEPVEVLVNGKKVAYGEVVVVDENFGVRLTSIVSGEDRIKSLGK